MRANKTIINKEVVGATFQFYTSEDIRKMSVKQITESDAYDMVGNPVVGGLYDIALGPTEPTEKCVTCGAPYLQCPGHFGHIELTLPVYNPVLFNILFKLFQNSCLVCHRFKHGETVIKYLIEELKVLYSGNVVEANRLREEHLTERATKKRVKEEDLEGMDTRPDNSDEDDDVQSDQDKSKKDLKQQEDILNEILSQKMGAMNGGFVADTEKSRHFESLRRDIMRDFLGACTSFRTPCSNCRCFSPAIRNGEAARTKLFIMPMTDKFKKVNLREDAKVNFSSVKEESEYGTWYSPWESKRHMSKLFVKEKEILGLLFGKVKQVGTASAGQKRTYERSVSIEEFYLEAFPISPNKSRPPNYTNGRKSEHGTNNHYSGIIIANKTIKRLLESKEGENTKSIVTSACEVQFHVNNMYDNNKAQATSRSIVAAGVKQVLEKKEGLFRKHMMGKRVNYAARTVISPDINLETNEMGVPQYFATTLTFPQPVTHFNYNQMAQAVINGPTTYPGANFIEDENGYITNLASETPENRIALSKTLLTINPNAPYGSTKKVYRHLLNGDYVLANRQPTLHKPGIMGHRVKILGKSEKTLRMHYCNCSTYNADFDGDEMNIHFPQSFLASSEIREIAANNFQYLGPRAGVPLRGLIQDHILTGVLLTKRDTLFTKADFQKILFASLWSVNTKHPIVTPPPCIWRPVPLWSGKQLITAALNHLTIGRIPLNLVSPSKIPAKLWGKHGEDIARDSTVIIQDNEMVAGILDKGQFGASGFGIIHTCYELYDPNTAGSLLTILGRMFTNYLSTRGFTCSMEDLLMNAKEEVFRVEQLAKANEEGFQVAAKFADQSKYDKYSTTRQMAMKLTEEREVARLDGLLKKALNQYTSKIIDTLIPNGQRKAFPDNNFSLMTVSGAKGSVVNFSQVSCLLGQQELEGKRVPRMVSGKTHPSFEPYDPSARAGGFIMDRFLTGVRPQDYFFHCMAGREGLIDTAVKTARSGYLQRCVIKHLEGLTVQYDNTVRDSDGSVIQFNYGEDSLEILKRQYLTNFGIIAKNFELFKSQFAYDELVNQMRNVKVTEYNEKLMNQLSEKKSTKIIDPVMGVFNPSTDLGCVSESFQLDLTKYINSNPDGLIQTPKNKSGKIPEKDFRNLMYLYYNRSMISPGDSVGLLCAQSIGEPSTQMTLNTFHLAGRGEANVTLGIPRLREIIMTASVTPSTPLMEIQAQDPTNKQATESLVNKLEWLKMNDIVQNVTVNEYYNGNNRAYDIEMKLIDNLEEVLKNRNLSKQRLSEAFEAFRTQVKRKVDQSIKSKRIDIGKGSAQKSDYDENELTNNNDDQSNQQQVDDDDQDQQQQQQQNKKKNSKSKSTTSTTTTSEDGDSVSSKKKDKKKQRVSYDEEGEKDEQDQEQDDEDNQDGDEEEEENGKDKKKKSTKKKNDQEEDEEDEESTTTTSSRNVLFNSKSLSFTLELPTNTKKVLMLNIVEEVAFKFIIKSCKGISRCFINEKTVAGKTEYSIQTEGINLNELFEFQESVLINKLYTNDIASILRKYGVEACKGAIVSEISNVFGAYGITVDKRHLTLLADYMTFEGGFKPLNRAGMENNPSPFQKMSFETTCAFLTKAAAIGDADNCQSPSARISLGQVVRGGTGAFDIVTPLN